MNLSPLVTPTNVFARLAGARSPKLEVAFSYDAYGLPNAQVFRSAQADPFVEKTERHADGSLATLEFNLPDQNFEREVVKYGYDSAGRLRSVKYSDASSSRDLYQAEIIDALGRVRKARHGDAIVYHADYADTGQRLVKEATVETPHGSRQTILLSFDALGRELSRREIKDGAADGPVSSVSYYALGRLALAARTYGPTTLSSWNFDYDPLGNILSLKDTLNAASVTLSYGVPDRDRVCRIDYGLASRGACNVQYDALGNMVSEPTRTGVRQLGYFLSGAI